METPEEIRKRFLANAEEGYRAFSEKIVVPDRHRPVGIRQPVVKRFAKEICKGDWRSYLADITDEYHEDMSLRAFIIAMAGTDINERFAMIRGFVPKIDNWAVCDSFCSALKVPKKDADAYWDMILPFLDTGKEFQIRFAVVMMWAHFVDNDNVRKVIDVMDGVRHDAYYVRMGVAWCLSVCFVKYPEETMRYLKKSTLDKFTFNKTLSKITESYRVSGSVKEEIRAMRRK